MANFLKFILSLFSVKPKKTKIKIDSPHLEAYKEENIRAKKETVKKNIKIKPVEMKDGSLRLTSEFKKLKSENKLLQGIILDLNEYSQKQFKKSLIITMIFRTEAEQAYLYAESAKYKKRKFKSPHQFWQAVDVRSRIFTQEEIKKMVSYLNKKHNNKNYYKFTAKCHSIGHGMHFHIQFAKK